MIYFGIVAVDSIFHRILAAQDIDVLAICDRIIEPVDEVHLCGAVIEFIRVPRENVANAHDLRQIAFIDCIGPTHDHNLAAAFAGAGTIHPIFLLGQGQALVLEFHRCP